MEELKLKEPIPMNVEQFQCPSCEKKFYVNNADVDELEEDKILDCPFCEVMGVESIRLFEASITKIFQK